MEGRLSDNADTYFGLVEIKHRLQLIELRLVAIEALLAQRKEKE
jgi:hypothetical protein